MRLPFPQLESHLQGDLAPCYLLCGDEPWQLGEAARLVRQAALRQGFEEREILEVEARFDWSQLAAASRERSLFSRRRLIEVRLSSAKIGRDGGAAMREACTRPLSEIRWLVLAPTLEYRELKTQWVQSIERAGVLVPLRALEGRDLIQWIGQRLRAQGLRPDPEVPALLAERVEGNLLAAVQEIEKLALLHQGEKIDAERLLRTIADSARFDLFDLTGAALAGDRARAWRVLQGLAAEGTPASLALWSLARELRLLARAAWAARSGSGALESFFAAEHLWEARRGPLRAAIRRLSLVRLHGLLARCARVDRQIKGLEPGDPWRTLAEITDVMAGKSR